LSHKILFITSRCCSV